MRRETTSFKARAGVLVAATVIMAALPLVMAGPALAGLTGPGFPPPEGGTSATLSPGEGPEGKAGGRTVEWTGLNAANYSHFFWGPSTVGEAVQIGAGANAPDDVSTLSFAGTIAPNVARWTGSVKIRVAAGGGWTNQTLQARMTLASMAPDATPIDMVDPASVGVDASAGVLVPLADDSFRFNYLFEVSPTGATWTPFLEYYNAASTDPTKRTLMSFRSGFYYNRAPSAVSAALATDEDTPLAITLEGLDADANDLTFTVTGGPTNGTLDGTPPNLTYTPNEDFNGSDSFTFSVDDGLVSSAADGLIEIAVASINDAPVADAQSVTTDEDTPVAITLTGSDTEGDELTFEVVAGPSSGSLTGDAPNLIYVPDLNFNGTDSFTFKANDGELDSNVATVDLTIIGVNDAPEPQDDTATTAQYTPVVVDALANDTDPENDELTIVAVGTPANGTAEINEDGTITYRPNPTFKGADSFTYTVSDGALETTATVYILEEGCGEDGIDALQGSPAEGVASQVIDQTVEPAVGSFDEGLAATLHDFNCTTVVPTEDGIDAALGDTPEPPEEPEVPEVPEDPDLPDLPPPPGGSADSRTTR